VLSVLAAPLQDVSVTSVDLAEESVNNKGDEHLFVTVTRVDDLVDDDGSILAERVMAVRVTFDVVENQVKSYENTPN
jgi:galactitol-specific phosphotransferase system IIB component